MSLPVIAQLLQKDMEELTYEMLLITMNDPLDTATITALSNDLSKATQMTPFAATASDFTLNARIIKIINTVFYSIISITMFLCFFSLSASMAANLYE